MHVKFFSARRRLNKALIGSSLLFAFPFMSRTQKVRRTVVVDFGEKVNSDNFLELSEYYMDTKAYMALMKEFTQTKKINSSPLVFDNSRVTISTTFQSKKVLQEWSQRLTSQRIFKRGDEFRKRSRVKISASSVLEDLTSLLS